VVFGGVVGRPIASKTKGLLLSGTRRRCRDERWPDWSVAAVRARRRYASEVEDGGRWGELVVEIEWRVSENEEWKMRSHLGEVADDGERSWRQLRYG
jgi:hypothetical protein